MYYTSDDLDHHDSAFNGSLKLTPVAREHLGNVVVVPDADVLFKGQYHRSGSDLVLSGGSKTFIIPDYFAHAQRLMLLSPEGAMLSGKVVAALAGPEHPGHYAQAGAPVGQQPVGRIEKVIGTVTIQHANGVVAVANVGDPVFQGDVVQIGSGSSAGVSFADGSALNLLANTRLVINEFIYDPNSTSNSALLSVVDGTMSFIAAKVAKTGDMRIETPAATIGIRGTAGGMITSTSGEVKYYLTQDPDGSVGRMVLTNPNDPSVVLTTISGTETVTVVTPAGQIEQIPASPTDRQTITDLSAQASAVQTLGLQSPYYQAPPPSPQPPQQQPDNANPPLASNSTGSSESLATANAVGMQTPLLSSGTPPAQPDPSNVGNTNQSFTGGTASNANTSNQQLLVTQPASTPFESTFLAPATPAVSITSAGGQTNTTSQTIAGTVTPATPAVSITGITSAGGQTNTATQTISGTVTEATESEVVGTTVTIFDNGTQIGTATVGSNGSWSANVTLTTQGTNNITASATDLAGNSGTGSVVYTLNTASPAVSISSAGGQTNTATQTISGTVTEATESEVVGTTVTIFDNGTQIGTATVGSNGSWSANVTLTTQGTNNITASATDLAGNSGTGSVVYTLNTASPAVSISSAGGQTNTATQTISGTVTEATESEVVGTTVTIFDNGTQIGTATVGSNGSWSANVTLTTQGTNNITASATDLAGNSGTGSVVYTLNTASPAVSISSAGGQTNTATQTISGTVTEATESEVVGTTVTIFDNGTQIGTATVGSNGSWSANVTLTTQGTNNITASATDLAGNSGTGSVVYTLNTASPAVSISSAGGQTNTATQTISGTVTEATESEVVGTTVTIFDNGTQIGTATVGSNGSWSANVTLTTQGTNNITASATDLAGNSGTGSVVYTLNTASPAVSISSAGGQTNTATQTISGTVTEATESEVVGTTVTIFDNGTQIGTATVGSNGSWSANVTLTTQGTNNITASATDLAGNSGTGSVVYTLNTASPAVSISSAGGQTNTATQTISGTVTEATESEVVGTTVTIFDNGTQIGTATVGSNGSWSANVTLTTQGTNNITASATDLAGNSGTGSVVYTLNTASPAVSISSAGGQTNTATQTISGTVTEATESEVVGTTVTIFDNGTQIGTATVGSNGSWSANVTLTTQGTNNITASATDLAGNSGTGSVVYTLNTASPAVSISSAGGQTNTATQTISGTVTEATESEVVGTTVTIFDNGTQIGTATVGSNGSWSANVTLTTQGTNNITASATDLAGNSGTGSVVYTLNTVLDEWTNSQGGSWNNAANWNFGIPLATEAVSIDAAGIYTVQTGSNTVSTLTTAPGTALEITGGTFTISNGTGTGGNAGVILVDGGASLQLTGTINNTGKIWVDSQNGNAATLLINGDVALEGSGIVQLDSGAPQNFIYGSASGGTLDNSSTIAGSGKIGNSVDGTLALINDAGGVINATNSYFALYIDTGIQVVNKGFLEASNGGDLVIQDPLYNQGGTVSIQGGTVELGVTNGLTVDFSATGGTLQLDNTVTGGAAAGVDATSIGAAAMTIIGTGQVTSTGADGIDATAFGAGDITVSMGTGDEVASGSAGIVAVNQATAIAQSANSSITVTAYGTINSGTNLTQSGKPPAGILAGYNVNGQSQPNVNGSVTVNNFANITALAGDGIRAFNYGNGDVTVNDNYGNGAVASTTISGVEDGIIAAANGGGSGDVTVNVGANAVISTSNSATALFGIEAFSLDAGNITVSMAAGDEVTSGSAGVYAVNQATAIAQSANSSITVTAYGTINSGTNLTQSGKPPAGILAGYNVNGQSQPNVNGSVTVNNFANITALAGDGIRAFNYGNGDVTVNDNYGNGAVASTTISGVEDGIIAAANGGGSGDVTVNVGANAIISTSNSPTALFGIEAFSLDAGNITVSMAAGDEVTSGSVGVVAVNQATAIAQSVNSSITVTADGIINSGPNLQDGGFPSAGILAGYNPNNTETPDSNVVGNVSVTNDATISAAGGYGISAFNFGIGSVAVTNNASIIAPAYGISASAYITGSVTVNNFANITASAGTGISAYNYGSGDVTVNDNYVAGAVASTSVSGAQYGIDAEALGGGIGNVTVNVGMNASISTSDASTALFGIAAISQDAGNITVSMATGDEVTSGSSGIVAVNLATIVPADSTIKVMADGTIDSGSNPAPDGNLPAGIVAGYAPNDTSTLNPNLAGSVSVLSDATINAAGGYGIWAFNLGIGNVTVTTQAGSSITVGSSSSTSVGIAAYALDGGNASITNAGTVTSTATPGSAVVQIITNESGVAAMAILTNTGTIAPVSLSTSGLAISESGSTVNIYNSGTIVGQVALANTIFNNESGGVWDVSGYSSFGLGTDTIDNVGVIDVAASANGINSPADSYTSFFASGTLTFMNEVGGQVTVNGAPLFSGAVSVIGTGNVISIGSNSYIDLGQDAGSSAQATVTGPTGAITAFGGLNVGEAGSGTLIAQSGATITADFLSIAQSVGSQGVVDITGAGTTVTTTTGQYQNIGVGFDGTASLTISDQAVVTTTGLEVGINSDQGVTDALTVDDATLNVTQGLTIGEAGSGTLTAQSGATITGDFLNIAQSVGSQGVVDITGAGTTVTTTTGQYQNIGVGFDGTANLTISDQAVVTTTGLEVGINSDQGVTDALTVDDATLNVTQGLTIGEAGSGTLTAQSGATITADFLNIAQSVGSQGVVDITGAGTTVTTTTGQYQNIGVGFDGTANLTISDQAVVTTTGLEVGINSDQGVTDVLTVDDATLNVTQGLTIGEAGSGTLTAQSGATVTADFLNVAQSAGSQGVVDITGAGTKVTTSDLALGSGGSIEITNGGTFDVTGSASGNATGTGSLLFGSGGGTLKLENPSAFNVAISGISDSSDVLNLGGFNSKAGDQFQTSTNYNGTTTTLTVTDETKGTSQSVVLNGNYTSSSWIVTIDGNGGVDVVDPPALGSAPAGPKMETVSKIALNHIVSVSIGGPGNDNFVFRPGIGADTIANVNPPADTIELDHFANAHTLQHLASLITSDAHGDAMIDLGHNDSSTTPMQLHHVLANIIHPH